MSGLGGKYRYLVSYNISGVDPTAPMPSALDQITKNLPSWCLSCLLLELQTLWVFFAISVFKLCCFCFSFRIFRLKPPSLVCSSMSDVALFADGCLVYANGVASR